MHLSTVVRFSAATDATASSQFIGSVDIRKYGSETHFVFIHYCEALVWENGSWPVRRAYMDVVARVSGRCGAVSSTQQRVAGGISVGHAQAGPIYVSCWCIRFGCAAFVGTPSCVAAEFRWRSWCRAAFTRIQKDRLSQARRAARCEVRRGLYPRHRAGECAPHRSGRVCRSQLGTYARITAASPGGNGRIGVLVERASYAAARDAVRCLRCTDGIMPAVNT